MRTTQLYAPTLRQTPAEAEVVSHQLMLRAGMIRKVAGGIYTYLPLAWRILKKIEQITREEMDAAGGQEIMMPIIQPGELWEESGKINPLLTHGVFKNTYGLSSSPYVSTAHSIMLFSLLTLNLKRQVRA